MSCMTILYSTYANHQIRYTVTSKKGSQPGDYIWRLSFPQGYVCGLLGCVWVYILTLSKEVKASRRLFPVLVYFHNGMYLCFLSFPSFGFVTYNYGKLRTHQ